MVSDTRKRSSGILSNPTVQGVFVGFLTFVFNLAVTMSGIIPVAEIIKSGGQGIAIFFYVLTYFISGSSAMAIRDFKGPLPFVLGESLAFFLFTVVTGIIFTIALL